MTTPKFNPNQLYLRSQHVVRDNDRALFEQHLRNFVPPDPFDVHAHWYTCSGLGLYDAEQARSADDAVGAAAYRDGTSAWMGDRSPADGLFFALPASGTMNTSDANDYVAAQLRERPQSRGLMLIRGADDPAAVEAAVHRDGFAGFKVYHTFADRPDTFNAELHEYLPRWAWEIADRHGLAIMLHIVKPRALADPANQAALVDALGRYRSAKLILAHAGRGFCADHTVEGVGVLGGLENVFFDTSAICEPGAFEAIVRRFGASRLMFGSDFPVCNLRGRCSSLGDGFAWLYEHNVDWADAGTRPPTLVGIESLLALRQACRQLGLTDTDIERIFCTTSRELMGLRSSAARDDGQKRYAEAKRIIPGGTQLLSKRPEMYAPGQWPPYFAECNGVEVIDTDDRRFIDMTTMGVGTCLLGYSDPDVNAAVVRRVVLGSTCTLNSPDEPALAEALLRLHPWAHMARFTRTGGEAMAVAVRIARARTGRSVVAVCGYHGWHDWYLAANVVAGGGDPLAGHLLAGLQPAGVPQSLGGTTLTFTYNRADELDAIAKAHHGNLAAVVMEPTRTFEPESGFLERVREIADTERAPLIFDEITAGFRLSPGGAHLPYGVAPDMAVFAKALGNGFPIAAVIGNANTMEAAQDSFISSTNWTEGVGFAAALATLKKLGASDVPAHLAHIGGRLGGGLRELANRHRLPLAISGHAALMGMAFAHDEGAALQTLFTTRMLERGILAAGGFYPSLAHEPRHVDRYLTAADEVFKEMAEALANGDVRGRLAGPIKAHGFTRVA